MKLPCSHQLNESVNIYPSLEAMQKPLSQLIPAKVVGVIFSSGKVSYHLQISSTGELMENVDSALIYENNRPTLTLNDIWSEEV